METLKIQLLVAVDSDRNLTRNDTIIHIEHGSRETLRSHINEPETLNCGDTTCFGNATIFPRFLRISPLS